MKYYTLCPALPSAPYSNRAAAHGPSYASLSASLNSLNSNVSAYCRNHKIVIRSGHCLVAARWYFFNRPFIALHPSFDCVYISISIFLFSTFCFVAESGFRRSKTMCACIFYGPVKSERDSFKYSKSVELSERHLGANHRFLNWKFLSHMCVAERSLNGRSTCVPSTHEQNAKDKKKKGG